MGSVELMLLLLVLLEYHIRIEEGNLWYNKSSSDGMLAISALDVLVVQYQSAFEVQCACAFVQSFIQSFASAIELDVNE